MPGTIRIGMSGGPTAIGTVITIGTAITIATMITIAEYNREGEAPRLDAGACLLRASPTPVATCSGEAIGNIT